MRKILTIIGFILLSLMSVAQQDDISYFEVNDDVEGDWLEIYDMLKRGG